MKISLRQESSVTNLYMSTKGYRSLNLYYFILATYNAVMLYLTQRMLREVETDTECRAPSNEDAWKESTADDYTDVAFRFKLILILYSVAFATEFVRSLVTLLYLHN